MKELGVEGWRGSQPLCSLCFTGGGGGGGGAEPDPEASLAVKLASFHLPASPHPSLSLSTPPPHLSAFISASLPPLILLLLLPPHPSTLPTPSSSAAALSSLSTPSNSPPPPAPPSLQHSHVFFIPHPSEVGAAPSLTLRPLSLSPSRLAIMFCWSPWKQIQVGCPL